MSLLTLKIFLMVLSTMVTVILTTVWVSAFYGVKIYLLFKNDKESKAEKRKEKKMEKEKRKKEKEKEKEPPKN
ncbi:TPA: hypothetical protein ACJMKL_005580 [Bacillus luti]|jgi:predicted membrane protein